MITSTGNKARDLLRGIQLEIFTEETAKKIFFEKSKYVTADNTYFDMRNTSTAKVEEVINCITNVPNGNVLDMKRCLEGASVNVQSFVFDRFLYAAQHFEKLGGKEISLKEDTMDFLRQCLIDLWGDRERSGAWA